MSSTFILAFEVAGGGSRAAQEERLMQALGYARAVQDDQGQIVDCWWVAEDDRHDRSDCDSAVFVRPGQQTAARAVLRYVDLTEEENLQEWADQRRAEIEAETAPVALEALLRPAGQAWPVKCADDKGVIYDVGEGDTVRVQPVEGGPIHEVEVLQVSHDHSGLFVAYTLDGEDRWDYARDLVWPCQHQDGTHVEGTLSVCSNCGEAL